MQLLPPQHRCQRTPSLQPNARASEANRETATFHIQKKESKGRRREKEEVFKFRYLLTETQKKHIYRHHVGRNPSSQGCGALLPASICLKLHRSFLPLSHAHRSVLKITQLPSKVYLRSNESVIHYNKSQCNINICRKNRLSAAPQQTLVLIQYNKTLADHRKKSECNSFKVKAEHNVHQAKFGPVKVVPNSGYSK